MKWPRSRRFKRIAVAAVAAAALVLVGLGVVIAFVLIYRFDTNTTQRVSGGGAHVVSITLTDFDATLGTLVVDRGSHLVLNVVNRGDRAHALAVDGGVRSRKLISGESERLDVGIVSERIDMSCTQRLHEFLGKKVHVLVV